MEKLLSMKQYAVFAALFLFASITTVGKARPLDNRSWNKNPVIAHRGAWKAKGLPENSIAALKEAIRIGCFGSEFDVHLTADDVLVVNHDATFQGMPIEKSTYKDLLKKSLSNGEKIPTAEAYLKAGMKQKGTKLIFEIKPSTEGLKREMLLADKCVALVKKLKAEDWVDYISFSYDILKRVLEKDPAATVAYLKGDLPLEVLKKDRMGGADYHFSVYKKGNWFEEANKLNLTINAWTVNDPTDMNWLLAHEVEFITTNEPELLFEQIKKAAVTKGWKLEWAEEFNYTGLPDASKWGYDIGGNGWGNNELQYYTEADTNNAFVEKDNLFITARKDKKDKNNYTSARLVTKNKFDCKYGRVEVSAMLPKGRGLWPAIWMLPTEWKYGGWPKSGEIDIMEHVSYEPDTVYGTVHTEAFNHVKGTQVTKGIKVADLYTAYHIYAIEWFEDRMDFYVDDVKYSSFPNRKKGFAEWPFDQEFHVILNLAVGGNWGGKMGIDESAYPATMKVDYVRFFKKE